MSRTALAVLCSHWLSDLAPPAPTSDTSDAADLGNAVHAMAEAIVNETAFACTTETNPYRGPVANVVEMLRAEGWVLSAEVPMALDPVAGTARLLKKGEHRDYSEVTDGEIPGTADVVGIHPDGRVLVGDWKTGRGARETAAEDTMQLHALASALAKVHGVDSVEVALLHVEPGDFWVDRGELQPWDLDDTARLLRDLALSGGDVVRPGVRCTKHYCPVRAVCPATRVAMERISAEAARVFPDRFLAVDNDDSARAAWLALKLYDGAAKQLKQSLHDYVKRRGAIEVGDGMRYAATIQEREKITLDTEAIATIAAHGATTAIEYSVSKEALKRALAAEHPGRGVAIKKLRSLVDDLRNQGKVSSSRFERFDLMKVDNSNEEDDDHEAA